MIVEARPSRNHYVKACTALDAPQAWVPLRPRRTPSRASVAGPSPILPRQSLAAYPGT